MHCFFTLRTSQQKNLIKNKTKKQHNNLNWAAQDQLMARHMSILIPDGLLGKCHPALIKTNGSTASMPISLAWIHYLQVGGFSILLLLLLGPLLQFLWAARCLLFLMLFFVQGAHGYSFRTPIYKMYAFQVLGPLQRDIWPGVLNKCKAAAQSRSVLLATVKFVQYEFILCRQNLIALRLIGPLFLFIYLFMYWKGLLIDWGSSVVELVNLPKAIASCIHMFMSI